MNRYLPLLIALPCCSPINETPPDGPPPPVCQSGNDCCQAGELVCTGDPDKGMVCRCFMAWDCNRAVGPDKCKQTPADTPDGGLGWSCTVDGETETCTRDGGDVPGGKNGWSCKKVGGSVVCSRPVNTPGGGAGWSC
ncbi:MAG: hypothetical protein JRI55_23080, partial [Deltaproteobacteria bacterium]|nr:hypothetical protein [Deltaproteobacteria bacterium]